MVALVLNILCFFLFEIVLADAHFPSSSICRCGPREVRADGNKIPELLAAIVKFFPLDTYVDSPVALMDLVESDKVKGLQVPIWKEYQQIVNASEGHPISMEYVERFAFYERAKKAFAVVHTGETAQYANVVIKKGVVFL